MTTLNANNPEVSSRLNSMQSVYDKLGKIEFEICKKELFKETYTKEQEEKDRLEDEIHRLHGEIMTFATEP